MECRQNSKQPFSGYCKRQIGQKLGHVILTLQSNNFYEDLFQKRSSTIFDAGSKNFKKLKDKERIKRVSKEKIKLFN